MSKLEELATYLETKADEVRDYLQVQFPEFIVEKRWIADVRAYRFYLIANGKNQNVVQISEEVLVDSGLEALRTKLARLALTVLFEKNPDAIIVLDSAGTSSDS